MPSSKKNPQDRKPKTPKYGKRWTTNLVDLELPSGELCQVRRPGVQGLIKAGVLHSLDSLTSIVSSETIPKSEGKPLPAGKDIEYVVKDPAKFNKMMEQTDKIVCYVVTQPKVHSNLRPVRTLVDEENDLWEDAKDKDDQPIFEEIPEEERDPELVYVDYIDAMDKMFIMNFAVGGSADLVEFRAQTEASMGGVPAGEAAAPAAE
jgi:hypothetical protein